MQMCHVNVIPVQFSLFSHSVIHSAWFQNFTLIVHVHGASKFQASSNDSLHEAVNRAEVHAIINADGGEVHDVRFH